MGFSRSEIELPPGAVSSWTPLNLRLDVNASKWIQRWQAIAIPSDSMRLSRLRRYETSAELLKISIDMVQLPPAHTLPSAEQKKWHQCRQHPQLSFARNLSLRLPAEKLTRYLEGNHKAQSKSNAIFEHLIRGSHPCAGGLQTGRQVLRRNK